MSGAGLRNILIALAFLLLLAGAVLRMKQHAFAWYFIGAAFLLYIIARFIIKRR
jgi:hypothetical protein